MREPVTRSEKALGTVFYVPNDPEGVAFLKSFRKYLNRGVYKMHVNGRNPDRNQYGYIAKNGKRYSGKIRQRIPLDKSTYFAVYLNIKMKTITRAQERLEQAAELARLAEGKLRTARLHRDALRAMPQPATPKPLFIELLQSVQRKIKPKH